MNQKTIIFIYGLPGSGKSTLAEKIQNARGYPWYNADRVRHTLSVDLGFSIRDRLEQARRMASLSVLSLEQPGVDNVIVDFVCPTYETHSMFKQSVTNYSQDKPPKILSIFMDTISNESSRFADTAKLAEYKMIDRHPDLVFTSFMQVSEGWEKAVLK